MEKSYGQLSLKERIEIYRLRADGKSLRFIANTVGRNVSTISRELERNAKSCKNWNSGYDPERAQNLTSRRRARGRPNKLQDGWLWRTANRSSVTSRYIVTFIGA